MRRWLIASILLLGGCIPTPQYKYEWSSEHGRRCYYSCKSEHAKCRSQCLAWGCYNDCSSFEDYCFEACQDLRVKKVNPSPKHDAGIKTDSATTPRKPARDSRV